MTGQGKDWHTWHDGYDAPASNLARRLAVVQEQIRFALDSGAPGPVRVVSLCAGQGRDLLGALETHPRRHEVRARLVELDPRNAAAARGAAAAAGLGGIEVVTGDAALTDQYLGMVPADVVLLCGLFGNIIDQDVKMTIAYCPSLCQCGATVLWTRHRRPPDLVPQICRWFEQRGFERQFVTEPDLGFGVGAHRFTGPPEPLAPGRQMFTFVGRDRLRQLGLTS